jgi:hypothetical protein
MKTILKLLVFSFVFFASMELWAQPCPPVDVNLNTSEPVQQWWMVLLDFLVQLSAPIITAIFGILGAWAVRRLTRKWDIEKQEAVTRLVDGFVVSGVAFAEEQARKAFRADKKQTQGAEKLQSALDYIEQQISSSGVDQIARDELMKLIESRLQMERSKPDGVVPSDPRRFR